MKKFMSYGGIQMTLTIKHDPNKQFALFSCAPTFSLDLATSIQAKLKRGEELTHDTALRVLKAIKWKSEILSFVTYPLVAIPLSLGAVFAGFAGLSLAGTALSVAHILSRLVLILGGGMVFYSLEKSSNGFLLKLSQAYFEQSYRAGECIRTLEKASHKMTIRFS